MKKAIPMAVLLFVVGVALSPEWLRLSPKTAQSGAVTAMVFLNDEYSLSEALALAGHGVSINSYDYYSIIGLGGERAVSSRSIHPPFEQGHVVSDTVGIHWKEVSRDYVYEILSLDDTRSELELDPATPTNPFSSTLLTSTIQAINDTNALLVTIESGCWETGVCPPVEGVFAITVSGTSAELAALKDDAIVEEVSNLSSSPIERNGVVAARRIAHAIRESLKVSIAHADHYSAAETWAPSFAELNWSRVAGEPSEDPTMDVERRLEAVLMWDPSTAGCCGNEVESLYAIEPGKWVFDFTMYLNGEEGKYNAGTWLNYDTTKHFKYQGEYLTEFVNLRTWYCDLPGCGRENVIGDIDQDKFRGFAVTVTRPDEIIPGKLYRIRFGTTPGEIDGTGGLDLDNGYLSFEISAVTPLLIAFCGERFPESVRWACGYGAHSTLWAKGASPWELDPIPGPMPATSGVVWSSGNIFLTKNCEGGSDWFGSFDNLQSRTGFMGSLERCDLTP